MGVSDDGIHGMRSTLGIVRQDGVFFENTSKPTQKKFPP